MGVVIDGCRMDHIRRCGVCGRKPDVLTGYAGYEGDGPFVISCTHGTPLSEQLEGRLSLAMSRSWYKTRAVRNWRLLWAIPA